MDTTISPQFVEGLKNRRYVNPTYASHVLPGPASPGKVNNREDTSYKEQYPTYKYNATHTKREVSQTNGRQQRVEFVERHSDAAEARSQFSEQNMSYRTRSSKASAQQMKMGEMKLTPMDVREVQVNRHEAQSHREEQRVRQNSKDESCKSPIPDERYKRAMKKQDTAEWQNPTYKSNIFTEQDKERQPARTSKNWESTANHDYELTQKLMKGDHRSGSKEVQGEPQAYKAWRRQTTEPIQEPKKYGQDVEDYGECPSPGRKRTHQPKDDLKEHFYQSPGKEQTNHARDLNYRYYKDDQIFPHQVSYEGDHNVIVGDAEATRLYQENPVYRQINDGRIDYTTQSMKRTDANKIMASERKERESAEKRQVLNEEKLHLNRLSELEDRNERLEERRKDYKKQVDDYHHVLAEERYDLSKVEKAHLATEKIKQEAEYVKSIGEMEKLRKKEQMSWYNNELHHQLENKNRRWVQSDLISDDGSHRNVGLDLGEYKEPSKAELLNNLKAQVENKNRTLGKYDKFEAVGARGGDFLGRKDQIDKWNNDYIHDHRRKNLQATRDHTQLNELKDAAIRENAVKRRNVGQQKQSDVELINDLVVNEKQQKYEEYARHQHKTELLKDAYNTQMIERDIKKEIIRNERMHEAKGTSFITEGEYKWNADNYNYQGAIQDNAERRYNNSTKNHREDAKIVQNLD